MKFELIDGHIVVEHNGLRVLVDTGSPVSYLHGEPILEELRRHVDPGIQGMLGAIDISQSGGMSIGCESFAL